MHKKTGTREVEIGGRIRAVRLMRGMAQGEMAALLGISQQQLYKYETGSNRVAASLLEIMSDALMVPVSIFFGEAEPVLPHIPELFADRGAQKLVRCYGAIDSEPLRQLLLRSAQVFAEEGKVIA